MILNRFNIRFEKKTRIGRGHGSGMGKTCGKGHKGQKARSGYSKRNCFEGGQTPLHIRLPKFGFKSKKKTNKTEISTKTLNNINISKLLLNISTLKKNKIIKNKIKKIKIIYKKDIKNPIKISSEKINFTKKALESIKNAGGIIV